MGLTRASHVVALGSLVLILALHGPADAKKPGGGGGSGAPSISVSAASPLTGTVTVSASASPQRLIALQIYLDTGLVASCPGTPCSYTWNTALTPNGAHTLLAQGSLTGGSVTTSPALAVTVNNLPAVSLTAPSPASGIVTISVSASDASGVASVSLYLDGTLLWTHASASVSYLWGSTTVANGTHSFQAQALDAGGNVGSSALVAVSVQNTASSGAGTGTYLTDSNLYQVPALPRPDLRVPLVDPVFGSTITRITDPSMAPNDPNVPVQGFAVEYSRYPAMNADNSKALLQVLGGADRGGYYLIDIVAGTKLMVLAPFGDPEFSWHPTDPNRAFYRYGNEIRVLHADTGQVETLMTLSRYGYISAHEEGRPSDDWRYYAFLGYFLNADGSCCDWNNPELGVADLVAKQVIATMSASQVATFQGIDWVGMSPSGASVVVCSVSGTIQYLPNLTLVRTLFPSNTHSDFALDINGQDTLVYDAVTTGQVADFGGRRTIAAVNLANGQKTALLDIGWQPNRHLSGIGSRGHPGWILISTYEDPTATQVPFDREIFWLATDGGGAVKRLAHHHSDVAYRTVAWGQEKDYFAEPHATSSWDGSAILFTAVWGDYFTRYDVYTITGTWWP